jgi:hypothetical protein
MPARSRHRRKLPARKVLYARKHIAEFSAWNFIIFLTLAFILLVVVLTQMNRTSFDLRSKAGLACPQLTAPRAEDCPGGWTFKRDTNGCLAFFCEPKN